MTDPIWNLDRFAGMARTEYVLDASCVSAATLAGMATVTGTGTVAVPSTMVTPGNLINLAVGAAAGAATIKIPVQFGRAAGSLLAAAVDVEGIKFTGLRPTFKAHIVQQGTGADNRTGMTLDESGAHLLTRLQPNADILHTVQSGNMTKAADGNVGFLLDYEAQASVQGHSGWSMARQDSGVPWTGSYCLVLSNETKASPAYFNHTLGFRQATLTCIWGVPGGVTTKVF